MQLTRCTADGHTTHKQGQGHKQACMHQQAGMHTVMHQTTNICICHKGQCVWLHPCQHTAQAMQVGGISAEESAAAVGCTAAAAAAVCVYVYT
jgi:hypothetical protein